MSTIIGTTGHDTITGTAGEDLLQGLAGDDRLFGDAGNDTLEGGEGTDQLSGGPGNDTLEGGDGDYDWLDGGPGDDLLDGGEGTAGRVNYRSAPSAVVVDLVAGTASGGDGNDTLLRIERAYGSDYDDTLSGDRWANYFLGDDGNDLLRGLGGNDGLDGHNGDDTLIGGDGLDSLHGDAGNDTLKGGDGDNDQLAGNVGDDLLDGGAGADDTARYESAPSGVVVDLAAGTASGGDGNDTLVRIENVAGSFYDDTLSGDEGANELGGQTGNDLLRGMGGNDYLDGSVGIDTLEGGAGNDTYTGDSLDTRVEEPGGGIDTILAWVSWELDANFEGLILQGYENLNGKGNAEDNAITGNSSANHLGGGTGADTLNGGPGKDICRGGAGADTLIGGRGNDLLSGGAGSDELTGGIGADSFLFDAALSATNNLDTLTAFAHGTDRIRLDSDIFTALTQGALTSEQFHSGAEAVGAHDADDRIVYNTTTGALYYDADGTGGTAAIAFAVLGTDAHPTLTEEDFAIVG